MPAAIGCCTRQLDFRSIEMILKKKEIMNSKYIVFVIGLAAALAGREGGGAPEINSTNCSGGGMQAILPSFKTEAERQAFIDKCQSLTQK